jgi:hypothetical protein
MSRAAAILAAFWLTACAVVDAQPQVTARTEPDQVMAGVPFHIVIEAEGSVRHVDFPTVPGLSIDKQPSTRRTGFTFINGRVSSSLALGYRAVAENEGRLTIPEIGVEVDGVKLYTKPIVLDVAKPSQSRSRSANPFGIFPPRSATPYSGGRLDSDDLIRLTTEVDKEEVYLGEAVRLVLSIWTLNNPRLTFAPLSGGLLPPQPEGFYATPLDPPERQIMEYRGRYYQVHQVTQTLFPTVAGDLETGEWSYEAEVSVFPGFERDTVRAVGASKTIHVKPLPDPPSDFSGAVGAFSLDVKLTRQTVDQGVPTQLVVTVQGRGNPDAIAPPAPGPIDGAEIQGPETEVHRQAGPDSAQIVKTFTYDVTPVEAHEVIVPPLSFVFFDPDAGKYVTVAQEPLRVAVRPAPQREVVIAGTNPSPKEEPVAVLNEDIRPIIADAGRLRTERNGGWPALAALFLPVLAYAGIAAGMTRHRRFNADARLARAHRALARCRKRLAKVNTAKDPPNELYKTLVSYIADKLGLGEAGMTSSEADAELAKAGVPDRERDSIVRILRACERARYGSGPLRGEELAALTEAALVTTAQLEQTLNGGQGA